MNEKLIRRAALKYRNWQLIQLPSLILSVETSISENINRANDKADQMRRWAKRFFVGSKPRVQKSEWDDKSHIGIVCPSVYKGILNYTIPELGGDIIALTKYAMELLKSRITKETITVLPLREAICEVRIINEAWPEVEFRDNILSVMIKDVFLSDDVESVYLGDFWIHVNLTNPLDSLRIESIDCIKSSEGFTHPHVSKTKLCIGHDGGISSQYALCQGRLEDYFRIVEAVLRTYNAASPHEGLSEWYNPDHENQFFCEGCDEWQDIENSCYCEGCGENYCTCCNQCAEEEGLCTECGEWFCETCRTTCHCCGNILCYECSINCDYCGSPMCPSCTNQCIVCDSHFCNKRGSTCDECGDSVCEDCLLMCSCCEHSVCDNCASACSYCGEICCNTCLDKDKCSECGGNICRECKTTCNECDRTVCNGCNSNLCEHCGVMMCNTCNSEHNCLLEKVESST